MFFSMQIMKKLSAFTIISKLEELGRSLIYTKTKNDPKTLLYSTRTVIGKRLEETKSKKKSNQIFIILDIVPVKV